MNKTLPLTRNDVTYNSETGEVTLTREKFDQLMGFLRDTLQELENEQDSKRVAEFDARRANAAEKIYEVLLEDMEIGSQAITKWVEEHPISELAQRSGIPYATCHRIVNSGLPKKTVRLKDYAALLKVTSPAASARCSIAPVAVRRVVVGAGAGKAPLAAAAALARSGVKIISAGSAGEVMQAVKETHPDMIIIDGSSSQFNATEVGNIFRCAAKSPVFVVGEMTKQSIAESAGKIMNFAEEVL